MKIFACPWHLWQCCGGGGGSLYVKLKKKKKKENEETFHYANILNTTKRQ